MALLLATTAPRVWKTHAAVFRWLIELDSQGLLYSVGRIGDWVKRAGCMHYMYVDAARAVFVSGQKAKARGVLGPKELLSSAYTLVWSDTAVSGRPAIPGIILESYGIGKAWELVLFL
ncbi:hypothetical protein P167DRAFT_544621 [Morchella conica CCBAS932]|uniref:Uncharacterized protein n=1 Tax=Morchella conica CCBAS932 TaxID=1392247 RepID=A0A3N4KSQ8_9PEZI|nr:hypothetical protein P167DRAFT_544621 [Morchella conica CCBAS932]